MPILRLLFLLLLAASPAAVAGEAPLPPPPGTDIWLADLAEGPGGLKAHGARNLTDRPGYDNQPAFVSPGTLLGTSMFDGQTDAWRLQLDDDTVTRVLETPESEYSPTPVPGGGVSVVRVALDGTQQLWWLPPGAAEYQLLFPMLEGVGYHAWVDADRVALFMVRNPPELHVANRRTGQVLVLAKNIGRSLHAVPGQPATLAFIEAGADGKRWIKQYDFASRRISSVAPVAGDSQDFVFLPDGRLLMANGRELLLWQGDAWRRVAHFGKLPGEITRLAVSQDAKHLAMVVDEADTKQ